MRIFLKTFHNWLPAVDGSLKSTALLLYSLPQLERAVVLPQRLQNNQSQILLAVSDRPHRKEISSYICPYIWITFSDLLHCKNERVHIFSPSHWIVLQRETAIKAIFTSTSFSSASKRASCSCRVLTLSSWNSFCDLAFIDWQNLINSQDFHRNCSATDAILLKRAGSFLVWFPNWDVVQVGEPDCPPSPLFEPWGRRDRVLCSGGEGLALPPQQPP